MATFYNQATLIFDGSSTTSNITEGQLLIGITGTKTALTEDYIRDDSVTYAVSIINSGSVAENNITVTDDLGTFFAPEISGNVTPLEYIDGSVRLYINGILVAPPTVTTGTGTVAFGGINLTAASNALLIYEARVNEYASLSAGSSITNTVNITSPTLAESVTDSATVPVREWTSLTISKAICPATITDNEELTYTFIIQNTGNTPAVATDNVIITDTFTPVLNNITVALDGVELTEGVGYTYNGVTGEFSTLNGAISVPAATFTRSTVTGAVMVTPGVSVLTVKGTV